MQIVSTHKNTDFDALASMVAATILYPDAVPVLPLNINPNVKAFLSIHKDLFSMVSTKEINLDEIERLIVVDVNRWERLDRMKGLRHRDDLEIILWDHHSNKGNIQHDWSCQEEMGATITLMIRQIKAQQLVLDPIQATLFLAGIYEDTGNLTFPSSKPEDAYAAAYLLEQKADLNVVGRFLRPAYGEKQKNILFQMLQSTERIKLNGYSISICKLNIKGHVESLAVVVNMYREIVNVDAAFGVFMNEDRGRCIVIGRSNAEDLNIGAIMRRMGGGGHPAAGSAMLKSDNTDEVEEWIKELIQKGQRASVQISDLMSFPVFTISSDTRMQDAAMILREKGCTGLPVVDDDKLKGIISRRDFRKIKRKSQMEAPVKAFMSTDVKSIDPGISPMQAARLMVKHDIGRFPVVENGRIIGIVTRSDTMHYIYDLLPD